MWSGLIYAEQVDEKFDGRAKLGGVSSGGGKRLQLSNWRFVGKPVGGVVEIGPSSRAWVGPCL